MTSCAIQVDYGRSNDILLIGRHQIFNNKNNERERLQRISITSILYLHCSCLDRLDFLNIVELDTM